MSFLKRTERYFSAFFKLGRTARLAKSADRAARTLEPRLDALGEDLMSVSEREAEGRALLDDLDGRLEAVTHEANDTRLALDERLDGVERRLDGQAEVVSGLADEQSARMDASETHYDARLDGMEARAAARDDALAALGERLESAEHAAADRVGALEAEIDRRAEAQRQALEARADHLEKDLGERLEALERAVFDNLARLETRLSDRLNTLEARLDTVAGRLDAQEQGLSTAAETHDRRLAETAQAQERGEARLRTEQAGLSRAYADLSRRLDIARFQGATAEPTPPMPTPEHREGLSSMLDAFYGRLEDRFRGARAEIRERLTQYLPEVREAAETTAKPVFDLGCGRGEWIELLGHSGIPASGVDLNPVQLADALALGLDVREGDALKALADAPDGAFGTITAHHLIEHLPFDAVVWMVREALRALAPGGLLIVETPNPRNLIVGATTFHIDPTHRRPLPAEVLTTLFDTVGFHPVEARHLHPSDTLAVYRAETLRLDPHVADLLFGPQDLAVVGTRPLAS